jgi:adenosylcobyric acid synthase
LHGLFDADDFRHSFLNKLRRLKGLQTIDTHYNFRENREAAYNSLAKIVRENVDMKRIYNLMGF